MSSKGVRGAILLERVHCFTAGHWQGEDYTTSDLRDIVRNFNEFSAGPEPLLEVPFVIGHEEDQPLTGVPAVGWVRGLTQEGPDLYADVEQLFPEIASLIEVGAYTRVSPEIYPRDNPPEGVPARGCMMRRLSALGGQLPHIKQLSRLPKPVRLSEEVVRRIRARPTRLHSLGRTWNADARTWACFSEVVSMAESALKEAAVAGIKASHPDLTDEFLDSLSDDQLAMLAAPAEEASPMEGEAAATGMADPMPGTDAGMGGAVAWPDGKDRQAIEAELAQMGEDPAALAAMSDADLLALYEEKAGARQMSEGDPFDPLLDEEEPAVPTTQPKKRTVTEQFSERRIAALEKRLKQAEAAQRRQEQLQRQRLNQERHGLIATFCERMVKTGRLSPAQVETAKDGTPIGPVVKALHAADAVRKFSDGKSALQLQMDALEALPARHFGEQVPDPVQGSGGGTLSQERERQLLAHTRAGRRVLAQRESQAANHRAFAETMGEVLRKQQQNGHN